MWIFTNNAFVSIVVDREKTGNLLVRGRKKGDIERLMNCHGVYRAKVGFTRNRDYAYRASVPAIQVSAALGHAALLIDYPNFKDSVKDDQRHDAYLSVWTRMFQWGRSQVGAKRMTEKTLKASKELDDWFGSRHGQQGIVSGDDFYGWGNRIRERK